jgi:hypothetical protein
MVRMGSPQLTPCQAPPTDPAPGRGGVPAGRSRPDNCGIEPQSTTIRTASGEVAGSRAPGT